jgi:hypothetical protein
MGVFPCQPVLFFKEGECFPPSASIIFLGGRECFSLSASTIFLGGRVFSPSIILADREKHSFRPRKIILADRQSTLSHLEK